MDKKNNTSINSALIDRGDFFRLILIGSLLALGINLSSSFIETISPDSKVAGVIGAILILFSLISLGLEIFGERKIQKNIQAVIFVDKKTGNLVSIRDYDFSEKVNEALSAIFSENPAFQSIWEKEPLLSYGFMPKLNENESPKKPPASKTKKPNYIAIMRVDFKQPEKEPKSFDLLRETLEFVIIEKLSTHLGDYFNGLKNASEKYIKEYVREDIPDFLLKNRVLSMLSSPLETRVPFSEIALSDKQPEGEIVMVKRDDGTLFSRFDLTLPKGSKFQRAEPNVFQINSNRLKLQIKINYNSASTSLPYDFIYLFTGLNPREVSCQKVEININASIKKGALLLPGGWEFYQWLDLFIEKLETFASFDKFLDQIDWKRTSAMLYVNSQIEKQRNKKKAQNTDKNSDVQNITEPNDEKQVTKTT